MKTFEYPDRIVVAYIDGVRALPTRHHKFDGWEPRRERRDTLRFRQRAASRVLDVFVSLIHWSQLRSSLWFIANPAARRAYRSLFRDLRQAGWGLSQRVLVSHGLTAVRLRATGSAVRLYDRTMGTDIPRSVIGWM